MQYARLRRPLSIVVIVLVVMGMGVVGAERFMPATSPAFSVFPLIVALHVVSVGVWVTFVPWQFVQRIRSRWLPYHRWAGRTLVAVGMVVGGSALVMGWVFPLVGWPERVLLGFYGSFYLFSLTKGFLAIRARRTKVHREWMIRAFALTLAVVTVRLVEIPAILVLGRSALPVVYVVANTFSFTLHALVAEVWIRATRRKVASASRSGAVRVPSLSERPVRS